MKNMLKDTFILFMITLFAGLILSVVYEVTKEPIAVQEEKIRQDIIYPILFFNTDCASVMPFIF